MKNQKNLLRKVCAVLLGGALLAGCQQAQTTEPATEETIQQAIQETAGIQPEETLVLEPDHASTGVDTPYGTIYYPLNRTEAFRAETAQEDNYTVTFYGSADGVELPLFKVIFGNAQADGHLFGTVDGGTTEVRVHVIEFEADGAWSQDTADTFYAMQEEVNTIIAQIYELPGFEASDN